MAKIKRSVAPGDYIKRVKARLKTDESATYTFRFNKGLMEKFKAACEEGDVTMTDVLREFIEDVVKNK